MKLSYIFSDYIIMNNFYNTFCNFFISERIDNYLIKNILVTVILNQVDGFHL